MYTDAEKKLIPLMFFILLLITISLWLLLRHRGKVAQSIPFIVITLALIAGEVAKQVISYRQGYNLWHLPLHFCSTYFLWFSLAEFSFGKMRRTMQNIAFVATMYLFVAFYVSPRGVLGDACEDVFADYFTAHSFFYHHLVILYMMLSIAFKRFKPKKSDAWVWIICFACYFAVAATCAYTFDKNYFNILDSESFPPLESFRLVVGQVVYNVFLAFSLLFFGPMILRISAHIREKHALDDETENLEQNMYQNA